MVVFHKRSYIAQAGEVAYLVKLVPGKHEDVNSNPTPSTIRGWAVLACNLSGGEEGAGRLLGHAGQPV